MNWLSFFKRKKSLPQNVVSKQPKADTKADVKANTNAESKKPPAGKPKAVAKTEPQSVSADAANATANAIDNRLEQAKQRHRQGHIDAAEAVYLDILKSSPDHAQSQQMVAIVALQRGELQKAEQLFKRAIALDDKQADFHSNLGNVYAGQNLPLEAYNCFKRAIDLDPNNLTALNNAATALLSLQRGDEAKPLLLRVLAISANDADASLNLASVHLAQADIHAAIAVLRQGLEYNPQHVDLLVQLASNLEMINELDEAQQLIEQVNSQNAANSQNGISGRVSLLSGIIYRRQKRFAEAEQFLQRALQQGLAASEKTEAYNQLGLVLDVNGKAQQAFAAFTKSNDMMSTIVGDKKLIGAAFNQEVSDISKFVAKEQAFAKTKPSTVAANFSPIFFVGFPRSGTTLMEQILKAHPKLVTTDERSPLTAMANELRNSKQGYPNSLEHLSDAELEQLRQHYIDWCEEHLGDISNLQVIDKMPMNIVHLGLAKILFPNAKVVVALRDPRDVCLSCFMQKFEVNSAMANFLDLDKTAFTYQQVMNLWLQYRQLFAGSWLEYKYEHLVEDFDTTIKRTLNFIGVGWHDSINDYRQAAQGRAISTPSYRDVTTKINNSAMGRWRAYQPELHKVLPVVAEFVEFYEYPQH